MVRTPHTSCGREAPEELTGSRQAIFSSSQKPYSSKCCKWPGTSSSALCLPSLAAAHLCQAVWSPLRDPDSLRTARLSCMAASRGLSCLKGGTSPLEPLLSCMLPSSTVCAQHGCRKAAEQTGSHSTWSQHPRAG